MPRLLSSPPCRLIALLLIAGLAWKTFGHTASANPGAAIQVSGRIISDESGLRLEVTADIAPPYYIYSITQPAGGPLRTTINVEQSPAFQSDQVKLAGEFTPRQPPKVDYSWVMKPDLRVEKHTGRVTWVAPLEVAAADVSLDELTIEGTLFTQACTDQFCEMPNHFSFTATYAGEPSGAKAGGDGRATGRGSPAVENEPPAAIASYRVPGSHATLVGHVDLQQAAPGGVARILLTAEVEPNWHLYALADVDPQQIGGKPTLIVLTDTSGLEAGRPRTDAALIEKKIEGVPAQLAYEGTVKWTIDLAIPDDAAPGDVYAVSGLIGFMTCSDRCDMPTAARWTAEVPVSYPDNGRPAKFFPDRRQETDVDQGARILLAPLAFYPARYVEAALAAQEAHGEPSAIVAYPGDENVPALAEHPDQHGAAIDYDAIERRTAEQLASRSWLLWLGTAMLAGFFLNFMPCVLPVIGLKVMAFVEQAGESRSRVMMLNVTYASGMMAVFLIIASLAVFAQFSWGQQFQMVGFNIALAAVVFVFALAFIGVWEIPIPGFIGSGAAADAAQREGFVGAAAKGVLTTVLAIPCTGPFLAPALGWALTQPPLLIYLAFICVGLGMATPYLVLGANPRLIRFLPKPGAWMETFKQAMGFVLLGTVVFILTYIPIEYVVPLVAFLMALWAACWWAGRTPITAGAERRLAAWAGAVMFATVMGVFSFTWLHDTMASRYHQVAESQLPWEPFSRERLEQYVAEGKTVFIDFTADWCLNCKENEYRALNRPEARAIVDELGIKTLKADYTHFSPEIREMMELLGHGSGALPFYAVFPGQDPDNAILFSGTQLQSTFLDAFRRAGPSRGYPKDGVAEETMVMREEEIGNRR